MLKLSQKSINPGACFFHDYQLKKSMTQNPKGSASQQTQLMIPLSHSSQTLYIIAKTNDELEDIIRSYYDGLASYSMQLKSGLYLSPATTVTPATPDLANSFQSLKTILRGKSKIIIQSESLDDGSALYFKMDADDLKRLQHRKVIDSSIVSAPSTLTPEVFADIIFSALDHTLNEVFIVLDVSLLGGDSFANNTKSNSFISKCCEAFKMLLSKVQTKIMRILVEGRQGIVSSIHRNYVLPISYANLMAAPQIPSTLRQRWLKFCKNGLLPFAKNSLDPLDSEPISVRKVLDSTKEQIFSESDLLKNEKIFNEVLQKHCLQPDFVLNPLGEVSKVKESVSTRNIEESSSLSTSGPLGRNKIIFQPSVFKTWSKMKDFFSQEERQLANNKMIVPQKSKSMPAKLYNVYLKQQFFYYLSQQNLYLFLKVSEAMLRYKVKPTAQELLADKQFVKSIFELANASQQQTSIFLKKLQFKIVFALQYFWLPKNKRYTDIGKTFIYQLLTVQYGYEIANNIARIQKSIQLIAKDVASNSQSISQQLINKAASINELNKQFIQFLNQSAKISSKDLDAKKMKQQFQSTMLKLKTSFVQLKDIQRLYYNELMKGKKPLAIQKNVISDHQLLLRLENEIDLMLEKMCLQPLRKSCFYSQSIDKMAYFSTINLDKSKSVVKFSQEGHCYGLQQMVGQMMVQNESHEKIVQRLDYFKEMIKLAVRYDEDTSNKIKSQKIQKLMTLIKKTIQIVSNAQNKDQTDFKELAIKKQKQSTKRFAAFILENSIYQRIKVMQHNVIKSFAISSKYKRQGHAIVIRKRGEKNKPIYDFYDSNQGYYSDISYEDLIMKCQITEDQLMSSRLSEDQIQQVKQYYKKTYSMSQQELEKLQEVYISGEFNTDNTKTNVLQSLDNVQKQFNEIHMDIEAISQLRQTYAKPNITYFLQREENYVKCSHISEDLKSYITAAAENMVVPKERLTKTIVVQLEEDKITTDAVKYLIGKNPADTQLAVDGLPEFNGKTLQLDASNKWVIGQSWSGVNENQTIQIVFVGHGEELVSGFKLGDKTAQQIRAQIQNKLAPLKGRKFKGLKIDLVGCGTGHQAMTQKIADHLDKFQKICSFQKTEVTGYGQRIAVDSEGRKVYVSQQNLVISSPYELIKAEQMKTRLTKVDGYVFNLYDSPQEIQNRKQKIMSAFKDNKVTEKQYHQLMQAQYSNLELQNNQNNLLKVYGIKSDILEAQKRFQELKSKLNVPQSHEIDFFTPKRVDNELLFDAINLQNPKQLEKIRIQAQQMPELNRICQQTALSKLRIRLGYVSSKIQIYFFVQGVIRMYKDINILRKKKVDWFQFVQMIGNFYQTVAPILQYGIQRALVYTEREVLAKFLRGAGKFLSFLQMANPVFDLINIISLSKEFQKSSGVKSYLIGAQILITAGFLVLNTIRTVAVFASFYSTELLLAVQGSAAIPVVGEVLAVLLVIVIGLTFIYDLYQMRKEQRLSFEKSMNEGARQFAEYLKGIQSIYQHEEYDVSELPKGSEAAFIVKFKEVLPIIAVNLDNSTYQLGQTTVSYFSILMERLKVISDPFVFDDHVIQIFKEKKTPIQLLKSYVKNLEKTQRINTKYLNQKYILLLPGRAKIHINQRFGGNFNPKQPTEQEKKAMQEAEEKKRLAEEAETPEEKKMREDREAAEKAQAEKIATANKAMVSQFDAQFQIEITNMDVDRRKVNAFQPYVVVNHLLEDVYEKIYITSLDLQYSPQTIDVILGQKSQCFIRPESINDSQNLTYAIKPYPKKSGTIILADNILGLNIKLLRHESDEVKMKRQWTIMLQQVQHLSNLDIKEQQNKLILQKKDPSNQSIVDIFTLNYDPNTSIKLLISCDNLIRTISLSVDPSKKGKTIEIVQYSLSEDFLKKYFIKFREENSAHILMKRQIAQELSLNSQLIRKYTISNQTAFLANQIGENESYIFCLSLKTDDKKGLHVVIACNYNYQGTQMIRECLSIYNIPDGTLEQDLALLPKQHQQSYEISPDNNDIIIKSSRQVGNLTLNKYLSIFYVNGRHNAVLTKVEKIWTFPQHFLDDVAIYTDLPKKLRFILPQQLIDQQIKSVSFLKEGVYVFASTPFNETIKSTWLLHSLYDRLVIKIQYISVAAERTFFTDTYLMQINKEGNNILMLEKQVDQVLASQIESIGAMRYYIDIQSSAKEKYLAINTFQNSMAISNYNQSFSESVTNYAVEFMSPGSRLAQIIIAAKDLSNSIDLLVIRPIQTAIAINFSASLQEYCESVRYIVKEGKIEFKGKKTLNLLLDSSMFNEASCIFQFGPNYPVLNLKDLMKSDKIRQFDYK